MDNEGCIAYKNKNSKMLCKRKCIYKTFCGYHKNIAIKKEKLELQAKNNKYAKVIQNLFRIYNYKYLDKNYKHFLINCEDSWCEISHKHRIYLENHSEVWDIRVLLKHFEYLLNVSNNSLPYPQLFTSPYTKKIYTRYDIFNIIYHIAKFNIEISKLLKYFFLIDLDELYKSENSVNYIIQHLEQKFRYQVYNSKDSQDNYHIKWVDIITPLTRFEIYFNKWNTISPYIMLSNSILIPNPEKLIVKEILNNIEDS